MFIFNSFLRVSSGERSLLSVLLEAKTVAGWMVQLS